MAPFPTNSHSPEVGVRVTRPSFACIQIWSLGPTKPIHGSLKDEKDPGEMKCEMVLCIDAGPAHDLKWCPLPSNDDVNLPVLNRWLLHLLALNTASYYKTSTQTRVGRGHVRRWVLVCLCRPRSCRRESTRSWCIWTRLWWVLHLFSWTCWFHIVSDVQSKCLNPFWELNSRKLIAGCSIGQTVN